jgi:threonine aldolase
MNDVRIGAACHGLPIHMDGARLFNAALSLGVEAIDIADHTDSLMFCLSKGLGAPVGSLLCGPKDYIDEAFFKRKIMGGGMRQAGILAAAGLVALNEELPRLGEDHEKAARLAAAFAALDDAFEVMNPHPEINMVFLKLRRGGADIERRFLERLAQKDILTYPAEGGIFRFVAHRDVDFHHIDHIIKVLPDIAGAV